MTITYEANIVVGCYISQVDIEDIPALCIEYDMDYYEESGFIGFKVEENQKLNIHSVQALGKVASKFRAITGQDATVKACLYKC